MSTLILVMFWWGQAVGAGLQADAPKADTAKADAPKPDAAKPDAAKPDAAKPADGKPADGKPAEPANGKAGQEPPPIVVIPNLPPKERLTPLEAKLDSGLRALMRAAKSADAKALEKAVAQQALVLDKERVAVKLIARTVRELPLVERRLAKLGGSVTARHENALFGLLPVRQIEVLARDARVLHLQLDLPVDIKKIP